MFEKKIRLYGLDKKRMEIIGISKQNPYSKKYNMLSVSLSPGTLKKSLALERKIQAKQLYLINQPVSGWKYTKNKLVNSNFIF